jgi:predicted nucleic acid-binding protein
MNKVFLDTAYAIALAASSDRHHQKAVQVAIELEAKQTRLVTTRAIVLEIGNALAKQRYRQAAIQLLTALEADPLVEIIPVSEALYQRGFQLYTQRTDKDWGIIDCISFVVMQEQGLTDALTTDVHFQQAGFRTLLRED